VIAGKDDAAKALLQLHDEVLAHARTIPSGSWQGQRTDLTRYSASQQQEVELRGVTGFVDLPEGLRELLPLFTAAQWLHVGKGTTLGMGQLAILPVPGM
jgi:hypothetical protein